MSTLEVDVNMELTSVQPAEDSFMILNTRVVDETSPPSDSSEDSQSEFSDSSFLDIDLDDEIEDEEIDTTQSIVDEHQMNHDLDQVSMICLIRKLYYKIL